MPQHTASYLSEFVARQDEVLPPTDTTAPDSMIIIQARLPEPVYTAQSLIDANVKNNKMQTQYIKQETYSDWLTLTLLSVFVFFALLQKLHGKISGMISRAFFYPRQTELLVRDGNIYNSTGFYIWLLFSVVSLGMLIFSMYGLFNPDSQSLGVFAAVTLGILLLYFAKISILYLCAHLLDLKNIFNEYVLVKHVFIITSGITAFFLTVLMVFYAHAMVLKIAILLIFAIFLYFLIRIFITWRQAGFSNLFYFFLYICSVEILPLLLGYKLYILQQ